MANTLKKSAASLKAIAVGEKIQEKEEEATSAPVNAPTSKHKQKRKTIMIGAHVDPSVRRSFALLQADPRNEGKAMNDLIVEAFNELFAKYNVPQTAKLG